MKKLHQIKFRAFIEELDTNDIYKCIGLIFIIILEKFPEPETRKFLRTWSLRTITKADRFLKKKNKHGS
jgi:hypothetical protein